MDKECPTCKGDGYLYNVNGSRAALCPDCDGTGERQ